MKKPIDEVSERLSLIEEISQIEREKNDNLLRIEELEQFIKKACDTFEDMEEPMSEIESLKEINDELDCEIENLLSKLIKQ